MPVIKNKNEPSKTKAQKESSLKKQAIRGTAWTIIGYGGGQALRLGSNIILTRLLVPELFGLMALVNTFITGLTLFSDIGIKPSIIRSSRWNDPLFLNTAWTLQVMRGFWLWFACCLITIPVAKFYEEPRFLWLIPVVGFTTVIGGFNSTSLATLNRKVELGKLTKLDFKTQTLSLAVTIIWAYFKQTIWALVGGMIVSRFMSMFWSHQLAPETSNRFAWDKTAVKELLSFGKWIFLSTMMTFLAAQADRLMLGKLLSLEMLGVYTIAFTFADIPRQFVKKLSDQVMFPILSQKADLPREELRRKILKKRWLLLTGMALIVTFLGCFGDIIVLLLYDHRYKDAAWMLPILSLGLWPLLLHITVNPSLYAIGKPVYVAFGNALKFLYMIVVLPLGYSLMGLVGSIIVLAFNDLPSYVAINFGLCREGLTGIGQDILATLMLISLFAVVLSIRYSLGLGNPIAGILS
ncbi:MULTISPECIES: oligosaccharide flippase family protein [Planktothricoides]|uniref:Oligosaccharide flippase family protein n=1 Tax=Planktothricoides raciborskii GIHE-MW2 TaxID=2792601 RepID=A0AAU8JEP5_9CYAN|nr:oligosaccharide flippase family protein [Planktothricoides sp. SR001]KOR35908.1 polysaccharide biosynthesis protein [Planktothricoides sp. SR001]